MSDTVLNDSQTTTVPGEASGFSLDGGAPRLGDAPTLAPPSPQPPVPVPALEPQPAVMAAQGAPTLPDVSSVMPSMVAAPAHTDDSNADTDSGADADQEHPMAHLMPAKSKPTESSRRAAEMRAAQKSKSKKIKIGVIAGMFVFTAAVGPPLGKWLVDAINEAGDTSTEEPAE